MDTKGLELVVNLVATRAAAGQTEIVIGPEDLPGVAEEVTRLLGTPAGNAELGKLLILWHRPAAVAHHIVIKLPGFERTYKLKPLDARVL